jgi:hypothetical protein
VGSAFGAGRQRACIGLQRCKTIKFSALAGEIMADSTKDQIEGKLHATGNPDFETEGQEVLGCQ